MGNAFSPPSCVKNSTPRDEGYQSTRPPEQFIFPIIMHSQFSGRRMDGSSNTECLSRRARVLSYRTVSFCHWLEERPSSWCNPLSNRRSISSLCSNSPDSGRRFRDQSMACRKNRTRSKEQLPREHYEELPSGSSVVDTEEELRRNPLVCYLHANSCFLPASSLDHKS